MKIVVNSSQLMRTVFVSMLVFAKPVFALDNKPANGCQLYVNDVKVQPNSHGSHQVQVSVRIPWLGEGETVSKVQFYGYETITDLGNKPGCHLESSGKTGFRLVDHSWVDFNSGDYHFNFRANSGSVVSDCPGLLYSSTGAFLVETNKATYWLNPNMDPSKFFVFDQSYHSSHPARESSYYNPKSCWGGSSVKTTNWPANECQLYVQRISTEYGINGNDHMTVVVKVPWLGDGQTIRSVRFYGKKSAVDLGNDSSCGDSPQSHGYQFTSPDWSNGSVGEYGFGFVTHSNRIPKASKQCMSYDYTYEGAFLLETNRGTYWLNPNMNYLENYFFDTNALKNLNMKQAGSEIWTNREDMKYYNPRSCGG